MRTRLLQLIAAAAVVFSVSPGYSQATRVALAPPDVEPGADSKLAPVIIRTIQRALLDREIESDKVSSWPDGCSCSTDFEACHRQACKLRGEEVLLVSLFEARPAGSGPGSVKLYWLPSSGTHYHAGFQLSEGPLENLVEHAVDELLEHRTRGPGPWLVVSGGPPGAGIMVDGKVKDLLPAEIRVTERTYLDQHTLKVYLDGYEDFETNFDLPREAQAEFSIDVRLKPKAKKPSTNRVGWALTAAGGTAVLAGGFLVATAIRSTMGSGCLDGDGSWACKERRFGRASKIQLISGSIAAVAGISLAIAGTFRLRADISGEHAALFATGKF